VRYTAAVPSRVVYLTAGIDSQRNRFEMYVWGWAPGEEAFLVDKIIIMGRPDEEGTLLRVDAAINKKYRHADGTEMTISRVCWDTGGIDGEIVYQRSKKHGVFRVLPVKGASVYGKPVITMPKTRNQRGVYLCEVGTDTAKEILYARMKADPTPADEATSYAIRFPDDPEIFSQTEAQQLVAEELVEKWEKERCVCCGITKSGVTKRWTAWCMPTRHYVCPCNAGSLIWLYWQNPGKKRRPGQP
ncbi:TPA: phage terminase large subunit family protein, partial [Escherichia coli]|nr:phage terminase large subunit family protein [Escherichia coli]